MKTNDEDTRKAERIVIIENCEKALKDMKPISSTLLDKSISYFQLNTLSPTGHVMVSYSKNFRKNIQRLIEFAGNKTNIAEFAFTDEEEHHEVAILILIEIQTLFNKLEDRIQHLFGRYQHDLSFTDTITYIKSLDRNIDKIISLLGYVKQIAQRNIKNK